MRYAFHLPPRCLLHMTPRCFPDVSQIPFRCLLNDSSSRLLLTAPANFYKIITSNSLSKTSHFCYSEIRFERAFAANSPIWLTWLLLADPGCSWLLLAAPGCAWLPMAAHGCSWLLLAPPGCSWLFLASKMTSKMTLEVVFNKNLVWSFELVSFSNNYIISRKQFSVIYNSTPWGTLFHCCTQ